MSEISLDLPIVCIRAKTLPEGWERAVVAAWEQGVEIATQYDRPGDPPSRDVTLVLAVAEPFAEPRIHRAMPGGIYDLEVYTQEVVEGIHDHWIDPEAGKWQYTYHQRLTRYAVAWADTEAPSVPREQMALFPWPVERERARLARAPFNQLEYVVETLARTPYSRRAQAITWQPWADRDTEHPACLQRLWFRLLGDRLVMSAHMRSNDAFKAAFMNMYAFTELQRRIAQRLSDRLGKEIIPGQYNHIADSFHIYGSYFADFRGFLQTLKTRTFEQRTYTTEQVAPLFEEAREKIRAGLGNR